MNRDIPSRAHELTEPTPKNTLRRIRSVENPPSLPGADTKHGNDENALKRSTSIDQLALARVREYLNDKGSFLTVSSTSSLSADTPDTPVTEASTEMTTDERPDDHPAKPKDTTDTPETLQKTAEQIKEQEKQREEIERIKKCEGKLSGRQLEEIHRCEIDGRVYTAESLPKLVDVLKEQGLTTTEDELAS